MYIRILMDAKCPDGLCPVRHAIEKLGGGYAPTDESALVRGGGVRPCCDVVVDNVRFANATDILNVAHGNTHPDESIHAMITRYMQPTCAVTARMLDRALTYIDKHPTSRLVEIAIKPAMTISALQHNLNEIARALGVEPPTLDPAPVLVDSEDMSQRLTLAGEYARELEHRHVAACKWLSAQVVLS